MCLIIVIPEGKDKYSELIYKSIQKAWITNPDGAGIMYFEPEKERIYMKKGLMSFNSFIQYYYSRHLTKESQVAIHLRQGTGGGITKQMTHPFLISRDNSFPNTLEIDYLCIEKDLHNVVPATFIMHNGIMASLPTTNDLSDTAIFTSRLISSLPKISFLDRHKKLNSEFLEYATQVYPSADKQKFAVLSTVDRTIKYFGDKIDYEGIIFSNLGFTFHNYQNASITGDYFKNEILGLGLSEINNQLLPETKAFSKPDTSDSFIIEDRRKKLAAILEERTEQELEKLRSALNSDKEYLTEDAYPENKACIDSRKHRHFDVSPIKGNYKTSYFEEDTSVNFTQGQEEEKNLIKRKKGDISEMLDASPVLSSAEENFLRSIDLSFLISWPMGVMGIPFGKMMDIVDIIFLDNYPGVERGTRYSVRSAILNETKKKNKKEVTLKMTLTLPGFGFFNVYSVETKQDLCKDFAILVPRYPITDKLLFEDYQTLVDLFINWNINELEEIISHSIPKIIYIGDKKKHKVKLYYEDGPNKFSELTVLKDSLTLFMEQKKLYDDYMEVFPDFYALPYILESHLRYPQREESFANLIDEDSVWV